MLLVRQGPHSGVIPSPPRQQNQVHPIAATPSARASGSARPAPLTDEPRASLPLADESGSPAARALEDYLAWAKYPPSSQPVSRARQQQRGISTLRRLDIEHRGKVVIRQSQDARYLAPGEAAVVTLSAFVGTQAQPLHVSRTRATELDSEARQPRRSTLERVRFHDDGVSPDRTADDGEVTAQIHAPHAERGAFKGDLRVDMELAAAGETGLVSFTFVCTGDPPARFTGRVREQLEAGSLALYLGLEVFRPGRYIAETILEDSHQRPVALLRFNDLLTTSQRELRLVAFGKLLRDGAAMSPYVLREVRGWRQLEAATPDRELMPRLAALYVTQAYSLAAMSDREWDSVSKAHHIEGLQRILAEQ